MDYQALIKKLLQYFMDSEGTDYIEEDYRYKSDAHFTPEEWAELERLLYELWPKKMPEPPKE